MQAYSAAALSVQSGKEVDKKSIKRDRVSPDYTPNTEMAAASSVSNQKSSAEQDVQNVLDILPHLERSFVIKLLSRYENAELAIAAVLEGNLPPDLDNNNPVHDDLVEKTQTENANLKQVAKLLDDMGIDGTKIIIKGDKRQPVRPKNERKVLDDKSTVREWKQRYEEYGYVSEDYEDEYDDSYDAMAESETKSVNQQLKHSGALNVGMDEVDDSESEESDEENGSQFRDARKDFCENPEAARERYAQQRNNRLGSVRRPPPPSSA